MLTEIWTSKFMSQYDRPWNDASDPMWKYGAPQTEPENCSLIKNFPIRCLLGARSSKLHIQSLGPSLF